MLNPKEEYFIQNLLEMLSSWIIKKIDNYNSSMYYEIQVIYMKAILQGEYYNI